MSHERRHRRRNFRASLLSASILLLGVSVAALGTAGAAEGQTTQKAGIDVVSAPVQVARTSDGVVGYRSVGQGTPIVLVIGHGLSIDDWEPQFIDRLAAGHRVLMIDNAGVGRTSEVPWSIPAMADQVAAFIAALHLRRPAVLGWSMGGMIAQALAVQHPDAVGRLVLAATEPGNGAAVPPSAVAERELEHPSPRLLLELLFPADQAAAAKAYVTGVEEYPHLYDASTVVDDLQQEAAISWTRGLDQVGHADGKIRAPTLVADGAEDGINPVGDDRIIAKLITGAQLVVYPDASHGFLFQDRAAFVHRLDRFLGT